VRNEKQDNTAKVIQLHDYDRSLGTDELNLAEFPLAALSSRTEPGQNTLLFEDTIFDEGARTQVNRSLVIAGSDHFGLPNAIDSDILLVLVHLSNVRNGFKSKRVEFSRYELIKFLGWSDSGKSYRRLDDALKRWTSVTLHYKHAWWQRSGQKWRSRSFHVIETLELRAKDEIHDDGLSSFTWNDVIFESFTGGNLRRIDLGVYFRLKHSTSRQMYRFLDKRFYMKSRLVFGLSQFATEHIGLSRKYDAHEIKRKLIPAIRELESIGFLRPLAESDRFRKLSPGNWEVTLEKGQAKIADTVVGSITNELKRRGVNDRVAKELASKFTKEHIEQKISMHDKLVAAKDKRIRKNPAGFLAASIRHNYETIIDCAPSNASKPVASHAKVVEPPARSRDDNEQKRFLAYWESLAIDDRVRIERDAMNAAPRFHRDTIARLNSSNRELQSQMRQRIIQEFVIKSERIDDN